MVKQIGKINRYFTQAGIADIVAALPKPATPMTDLLFPPTRRVQKSSPFVSMEDITEATGAIPLVRRGSRSYPVDASAKSKSLIEVDPINPSRFISAKDINDLIALGDENSLQAWVVEQTERLRNRVSETIETMSRQAMSGKISYPYATQDGISGKCEIDLGAPNKLSPYNLKGANLAGLQQWLEKLVTQHNTAAGASGNPTILLASDVYSKVIEIVTAVSNSPIVWSDTGCTLFGRYKLATIGLTYSLPGEKTVYNILEPGRARVIDLDNCGKLIYAALDDLDANLAPLPFYVKPVETKDPDGVKLVGMSKPIPALSMTRQSEQIVTLV